MGSAETQGVGGLPGRDWAPHCGQPDQPGSLEACPAHHWPCRSPVARDFFQVFSLLALWGDRGGGKQAPSGLVSGTGLAVRTPAS